MTLPTDPFLLREQSMLQTINGIDVVGNNIYLAGDFGLKILQVDSAQQLREVIDIDAAELGGVPTRVARSGSDLWLLQPDAGNAQRVERRAAA